MKAVHAESAGRRSAATLYAATGPASHVTGATASATGGSVFAQARLTPCGAQITGAPIGLLPWKPACGHHAKDQIGIWGSSKTPVYCAPGSTKSRRPKKRSASRQ